MSRFKVGDTVRPLHSCEDVVAGKEYYVSNVTEYNGEHIVSFRDDANDMRRWNDDEFETPPTGSYTVHHDGYQVGDPHLTINDATNWIQDNGVGGLVYTILETIARRKFEVVEKVQRELKAL
jgi:hypothetical protein